VKENPDARLIDRAKKFGVRPSAISYALKEMKITRKKKETRYQERNLQERMKYYRELRELIKVWGSKSMVFIDESGFEEFEYCALGWSKKGKKLWGEKSGKRGKRENLVAGRRKGKKDLIAPMLFTGSLNAEGFEGWLSLYLLPEETQPSILIMDNAPIKTKNSHSRTGRGNGSSSYFSPEIFSRSERY
jgi:putative transposase